MSGNSNICPINIFRLSDNITDFISSQDVDYLITAGDQRDPLYIYLISFRPSKNSILIEYSTSPFIETINNFPIKV